MYAFEKKIKLLLKVIPEEEKTLRSELNNILIDWCNNLGWWAPETVSFNSRPYWKNTANILAKNANNNSIDWNNQCLKIFNTPIEELDAEYLDIN